ncbi:hypothetical protein C4568_02995 [Candidatus Parcubacteria bacterium]|nr:MAG: hypothetical protein C4568_02995 [Candidatus Parcubacteria bacterium]
MRYIAAFIASLITLTPMLASADQIADLQAQILLLSQQLAAMQQQGAPTGCPTITAPIGPGSSGPNVTTLQQFLARDRNIYPEAQITGYYGTLTTTAVQRFQAKYNIVSSGSPSTTGYGRVGPKTMDVINSMCGAASNDVGAFMQVSPTSGDTPLEVVIQVTVNATNSCAAATYKLDYGDQSPVQTIQVPSGVCQPLQQTYRHTYTKSALYQIKLSSGSHSSQAEVVAQ